MAGVRVSKGRGGRDIRSERRQRGPCYLGSCGSVQDFDSSEAVGGFQRYELTQVLTGSLRPSRENSAGEWGVRE